MLHKAWAQVVAAKTFPSSRRPADAQEDRETSLTAPRVRLYLDIQYEILGDDGYRTNPADRPLSDSFELTLARQADGSYLLDSYDRS